MNRRLQPGSPEWRQRKRSLLAAESKQPLAWFYISFATNKGFIGGAIVRAHGPATALEETDRLRINPGDCEALAMQTGDPGPFPVNVLMSKEEMRKYGAIERVTHDETGFFVNPENIQ